MSVVSSTGFIIGETTDERVREVVDGWRAKEFVEVSSDEVELIAARVRSQLYAALGADVAGAPRCCKCTRRTDDGHSFVECGNDRLNILEYMRELLKEIDAGVSILDGLEANKEVNRLKGSYAVLEIEKE